MRRQWHRGGSSLVVIQALQSDIKIRSLLGHVIGCKILLAHFSQASTFLLSVNRIELPIVSQGALCPHL